MNMKTVRAMMIGDIVGSPGLEALEKHLPALITEHSIDFVTVNGENAAEGFGMTERDFQRITAAGADVVTSGNHVWEKRDFWPVLEREKRMLRPANYSAAQSLASSTAIPGTGFVLVEKNGVTWLVINLQGREYMTAIDCPFQCLDKILETQINTASGQARPLTLIDFHAESSREKETLAFYADGRASLIAGTHTHVQTADERILPKGSAYITDLGMTGIQNSIIGMDPKVCQERFRKQVQYQMKIAEANEPGQVRGVIAEVDAETGAALSIIRI
jgi:metallophosphoesterase (TIGR00282 family)